MQDIYAENISKAFGAKKVLDELSFTFKAGDIYCLMGESGAGKTTFLRILMGLEQSDAGSISGVGKIGAVFQENRLFENMTALDNVCMVLSGKNAKSSAAKELQKILPKEAVYQKVSELSGGMKRRVALVRAVMSDCDTLILDEPFTGLDYDTLQQVISYLLNEKKNRTLLIAIHDKAAAQKLQAHICLLTSSKAVDKIQ